MTESTTVIPRSMRERRPKNAAHNCAALSPPGYRQQVTAEFQRLQSHYLFKTQFCLVRWANEKGHVECLVDFGRANFLVPVPKVSSLAELNELRDERCRTDLQRQLWGKSGTKEVLLNEERAAFLPLPAQECEARRVTQANADSLSSVQFDTDRYSVPVKYAHGKITVVAMVDGVKFVFEDRLIARHRRFWGDRTDHAAHGSQGGEATPAIPQADQAARPHRS